MQISQDINDVNIVNIQTVFLMFHSTLKKLKVHCQSTLPVNEIFSSGISILFPSCQGVHSRSLSLSLTHTHTHSLSLSFSISFSPSLSLPLSLSLSLCLRMIDGLLLKKQLFNFKDRFSLDILKK
jgi:hypothetical protein